MIKTMGKYLKEVFMSAAAYGSCFAGLDPAPLLLATEDALTKAEVAVKNAVTPSVKHVKTPPPKA